MKYKLELSTSTTPVLLAPNELTEVLLDPPPRPKRTDFPDGFEGTSAFETADTKWYNKHKRKSKEQRREEARKRRTDALSAPSNDPKWFDEMKRLDTDRERKRACKRNSH